MFSDIRVELLKGSRLVRNFNRSKCYQNLVRSDMPGLKIVLAHIEVFHHFPVYTDWYEAFSRIKWEIVVTATVVVVVVVVG